MSYSRRVRDVALRWGPALGRMARSMLREPVFLVGFNKSGKSTLVEGLAQQPGLAIYPGEGNDTLWFRDFYPWPELQIETAPLWFDPDGFIGAVIASRADRYLETRAQLGLFQALRAPSGSIVVDSGMLAALLPDIVSVFPDARIVHMIRDGRVVSHMSAGKTLARIADRPERYRQAGCPADYGAVLEAQASLWCWTLDRVAQTEASLPEHVLHIRYEDWCEDPDDMLQRISAFVGGRSDRFRPPVWRAPIANHNQDVLKQMTVADLRRVEDIQANHLRRWGYGLTQGEAC